MLLTFKRFERKYRISEETRARIMPELLKYMEYDKYCVGDRTYSIYNIYFDSDDNAVINSSLTSPLYKEKLRMRCYCEYPKGDTDTFIELKKKCDGIVFKRRAVLKYSAAERFVKTLEIPSGLDYINKQVLSEVKYFIETKGVSPSVYISYDRYAYFDKANPELRISFDSNIVSRRDRLHLSEGSFGHSLIEDGEYIMEIKHSGSLPLRLTELLSENKIYPSKFSKYGADYRDYITHGAQAVSAHTTEPLVRGEKNPVREGAVRGYA